VVTRATDATPVVAIVLMRFDHIASVIINADHSIV
jgi:hypothetical protein